MNAPGAAPTSVSLCVADDETFWPWLSWPKFESMADRESRVVVAPLAGMADWGLGHPLDAEETALLGVLKAAIGLVQAGQRPVVLPPLRFVFGADASCAFAVDQPAAHAAIADVAASVAASGFRKLVLLNASPWNEELCSAAARDLRVSKGLHVFVVHLSALELDFHPQRSRSRRRVQTLLTALYGVGPEAATDVAPGAKNAWGVEPVDPLGGVPVPLAQAQSEGAEILAAASSRLAKLLSEIHGRAPLTAKITPV